MIEEAVTGNSRSRSLGAVNSIPLGNRWWSSNGELSVETRLSVTHTLARMGHSGR